MKASAMLLGLATPRKHIEYEWSISRHFLFCAFKRLHLQESNQNPTLVVAFFHSSRMYRMHTEHISAVAVITSIQSHYANPWQRERITNCTL